MPGFPQTPHPEDPDVGDKKTDSRMEYSDSFYSTALRAKVKELESSSTTMEEKKAELRNTYERLRIERRVKAEIEQEYWDILEQNRLKNAEKRTGLESIATCIQVIGSSIVTGCACGATIVFGVRYIFIPAFRFLGSKLAKPKPSLVRETSRFTVGSAVRHPVKTISELIQRPEDPMKDIILKPTLEEKLREIAIATRLIHHYRGYFRNFLLHGPPGTGKSMFAKNLAKHAGMHYTALTGRDVEPMKQEAFNAVHEVFNWAETSRKGMVLFFDEADAFLGNPNTEVTSGFVRAALCAFLYKTGFPSNKIMLILASNHSKLDWGVMGRMDEIIEFEIPGYEERERLVRHYFQKFILERAASKSGERLVVEFDFGRKFAEIVERTEGLSGHEISKVWKFCQGRACNSVDCVVTEQMVDSVIEKILQQHKEELDWQLMKAVSSRDACRHSTRHRGQQRASKADAGSAVKLRH